jgi:DNA primase
MDVIAMSRLGYDNAVATCGTSLTDGHFKLLKRYTDNVYLLFDQDKA